MDKERESDDFMGTNWKGFGSKSECVWMENDEDNDGVQVGPKAGLSLEIFRKQKKIINLSLR